MTCNTGSPASRVLLAQLKCFEMGVPHIVPMIASEFRELFTQNIANTQDEELQLNAELDKLIRAYVSFHPIQTSYGH